jgi:hypothetical protein
MNDCYLYGYGPECGLGTHQHHWINKSKARGSKKAIEYLARHPLAKVPVCGVHNAQTKLADTTEARRIIAARLCAEHGIPKVEEFVNGLLACFKMPPHELKLEVILGR